MSYGGGVVMDKPTKNEHFLCSKHFAMNFKAVNKNKISTLHISESHENNNNKHGEITLIHIRQTFLKDSF